MNIFLKIADLLLLFGLFIIIIYYYLDLFIIIWTLESKVQIKNSDKFLLTQKTHNLKKFL